MSLEERKPKSTLPMQEAVGCEIFIVIYVFHSICLDIQMLPSRTSWASLTLNFVSIRIKVLPSSGLASKQLTDKFD